MFTFNTHLVLEPSSAVAKRNKRRETKGQKGQNQQKEFFLCYRFDINIVKMNVISFRTPLLLLAKILLSLLSFCFFFSQPGRLTPFDKKAGHPWSRVADFVGFVDIVAITCGYQALFGR